MTLPAAGIAPQVAARTPQASAPRSGQIFNEPEGKAA